MARQQIQSPLAGAAPTLQPTARPLSIALGATPLPTRSPIMELGNAFKEFNPELRDMLRDASAREEKDATALGEITATQLRAQNRMQELEVVLKAKVDSGELSSVHLPAAQRGASLRSGMEAAETGFQTDILKALPDAIKGDPKVSEQIISENLKKYADAIPESDFYARRGFDHASQQVIASFRQRVAHGQAVEFDRVHREQLSNVGTELAVRLATADDEATPDASADFKNHIDIIRGELPKSEVNAFVVENVLQPSIAKLIDEGKYPAARQLLHEAEALDVTGKGGLLGQTAVAKSSFNELRNRIDREARTDLHRDLEAYRANREMAQLQGADAAGAELQKIRLDNGGALPLEARFNLINEFRLQNPKDAVKVAAYAEAVNNEYEHEEKYIASDRDASELAVQAMTLDRAKLDLVQAAVEAKYNTGTIRPSTRVGIIETIKRHRALSGMIDEQDYRAVKRDLFAVPLGGSLGTTVNFGDVASQDIWGKLSNGAQDSVELATTEYFKSQLEQYIISESKGDPNAVAGIKGIALDKATVASKEFARGAVVKASQGDQAFKARAAVAKQATAVATARMRGVIPTLQFPRINKEVIPGDVPGDAPTKRTTVSLDTYKLPEVAKSKTSVRADVNDPEADVAVFTNPEKASSVTSGSDTSLVDLKLLSKDLLEAEDPYKRRALGDLYGYIKGHLGFTPEEIKAGKTKHGVVFDPSAITANQTTVFRNLAELNKHWNNGEPDETFLAIGDAVDPSDKLTPRDLYLAQRALLRRTK